MKKDQSIRKAQIEKRDFNNAKAKKDSVKRNPETHSAGRKK